VPIRYNGPNGVEELIPAPFVDIQKALVKGADGKPNHAEYTFTLTGTIVNIDSSLDSPRAQGLTGMEGILAEQKRIRHLFSKEGGRLEIESPGGGGPNTLDAYCSVESITFNQGVWVNKAGYVVVLKSKVVESEGDLLTEIETATETWNITENEDGTFGISHQIQARGLLMYGIGGANDPLQKAREWVYGRMYDSSEGVVAIRTPPASFDLSTLIVLPDQDQFWNKSMVESVDPQTYTWTITENFIYNPTGNAREEWSASVNYEADNLRKIAINLSGTVIGFADKLSNLSTRTTNSKTYFETNVEPNAYTRIASYIPEGFTVNPIPTTKQASYDPNGTIRYSFTFVGSKGSIIPNAIDETFSVSDSGTTDIFAQIQIPGRANGPVVQHMKTVTLPERTVSITATLAPDDSELSLGALSALYAAKPNTNAVVDQFKPSVGYYYVKQDSEEWNPIKKQYSRTVSWTLQPEGATVAGVPKASNNPSLV
jgi:hypothetical protein